MKKTPKTGYQSKKKSWISVGLEGEEQQVHSRLTVAEHLRNLLSWAEIFRHISVHAVHRKRRPWARQRGERPQSSRRMTAPLCSARSARATRFWFCGRFSTSSFSNSARMWVFTASTLRCSSSAMAWLVGGVAKAASFLKGRQRATRTRRCPGGDRRRGRHLAGGHRRFGRSLAGAPVVDDGAAEAQPVAISQASPAVDPVLVDEGAVAGEPVVEQGALVAHDLELGVQGRDLLVPVEADVGRFSTADPESCRLLLDHDDALLVLSVAEDEEGPPAAFGLYLRLQLGSAGRALLCTHGADPTAPPGGEENHPCGARLHPLGLWARRLRRANLFPHPAVQPNSRRNQNDPHEHHRSEDRPSAPASWPPSPALALMVAPAAGMAAQPVKFGSKLDPTVQPSNSLPAHPCSQANPGAACTMIQNEAYYRPDGGESLRVPARSGRSALIAGGPGSFRLQIAKVKRSTLHGTNEAKVVRNGPTIAYRARATPAGTPTTTTSRPSRSTSRCRRASSSRCAATTPRCCAAHRVGTTR